MSQSTFSFGDKFRLYLISLIEKCIELIKVSDELRTCDTIVSALSRYDDIEAQDLPEVAPEEIMPNELTDDLKEQLMSSEEVLRDYGYETGFMSLVLATRNLKGRHSDLSYEVELASENFKTMLLREYGHSLEDQVFMFRPELSPETNLEKILSYLGDPRESDAANRREMDARRKYYLRTMKAVTHGDTPPSLLILETGFSVYYDSILNDCCVIGNYGPF